MLGFLYRIIVGSFHQHKWETIKETRIVDESGDFCGRAFYQRCVECGIVKCRDFT